MHDMDSRFATRGHIRDMLIRDYIPRPRWWRRLLRRIGLRRKDVHWTWTPFTGPYTGTLTFGSAPGQSDPIPYDADTATINTAIAQAQQRANIYRLRTTHVDFHGTKWYVFAVPNQLHTEILISAQHFWEGNYG